MTFIFQHICCLVQVKYICCTIDTLQQPIEACGIGDLKMSQYGISPDEFPKFVKNARSTMGSKFKNEYLELTDKDCIKIYQESYR